MYALRKRIRANRNNYSIGTCQMVKFRDLYKYSEKETEKKSIEDLQEDSKLRFSEHAAEEERFTFDKEVIEKRRKALYEKAYDYLADAVDAIRKRKKFELEPGIQIVREMVEANNTDDILFIQAIYSDNPDKFDIYHSINVALYAIEMAKALGWKEEKQVEIGMLGLFHDVGIAAIPEKIIYKQKQLSEKEFRFFKERPNFSYKILRTFSDKYAYLAECALQVYERIDGSGYPKGIKEDEIHEYAQIVGLVYMYEALIHSRPHREKFTHFFAIKEIIKSSKKLFQVKHLKALLKVFSVFPIHSYVRLNSNAIGQVIETYPDQPLRPKVQIVYDSQKREVFTKQIINLPDNSLLYIIDSVSEKELQELSSVADRISHARDDDSETRDFSPKKEMEGIPGALKDVNALSQKEKKWMAKKGQVQKTNWLKVAMLLAAVIVLVVIVSRQFGNKGFKLVGTDKPKSFVTNKILGKVYPKKLASTSLKPKDKKPVSAGPVQEKPIDALSPISETTGESTYKIISKKTQPGSLDTGKKISAKTLSDSEKKSVIDAPSRETTFQEVSGKSAQDTEVKKVSYPYSIQLESLSRRESAQKSVTFYKKKGLLPYWVKVNLGDKGTWFTLYAGYFENSQKAQKIIKKHRLQGVLVRNTKYASMVGTYSSKEVLDAKILSIKKSGYSPYTIKGNNGKHYLYVGAFITREGVKNKCSELISNGIPCQVVER